MSNFQCDPCYNREKKNIVSNLKEDCHPQGKIFLNARETMAANNEIVTVYMSEYLQVGAESRNISQDDAH
jgi:hypothetical protein